METTVMQRTLEGDLEVAGLTWLQRQLADIMQRIPETVDDEDLLVAHWLHEHRFWELDVPTLAQVAKTIRKLDFRRRRQELRHLYPYAPEEEARRQQRGRQGVPGWIGCESYSVGLSS